MVLKYLVILLICAFSVCVLALPVKQQATKDDKSKDAENEIKDEPDRSEVNYLVLH